MKTNNKDIRRFLTAAAMTALLLPVGAVTPDELGILNSVAVPVDGSMRYSAEIVLDALRLKANRQLYLTPVIEDGEGNSVALPAVVVNGRSMQIGWERGTVRPSDRYTQGIEKVVGRQNGRRQTVGYSASTPMEPWMLGSKAAVKWMVDSCGCGHLAGTSAFTPTYLGLNPLEKMRVAYVTPAVTELPVTLHEGHARVQYEVNRSELHAEPYVCRNGQPIDNRLELSIIDDSISNALSNRNMEITKLSICGYASPEGSYTANERLATERSRSLASYIADRYSLPADRWEYSAVAENWEGFLTLAREDTYLPEGQKETLIELIERPAYGPTDYDAKEAELKKRFGKTYTGMILPEWFPQLRTTKFQISTRLKPLTDRELAEVIKTDPDKMSLNQMFRVSRLYAEGSPEFNEVMDIMLRYYPDDPAANLNAASAAIKRGDYAGAERFLTMAGSSAEADNARGILATWRGDMTTARKLFEKASSLPEAAKNLELLGDL